MIPLTWHTFQQTSCWFFRGKAKLHFISSRNSAQAFHSPLRVWRFPLRCRSWTALPDGPPRRPNNHLVDKLLPCVKGAEKQTPLWYFNSRLHERHFWKSQRQACARENFDSVLSKIPNCLCAPSTNSSRKYSLRWIRSGLPQASNTHATYMMPRQGGERAFC